MNFSVLITACLQIKQHLENNRSHKQDYQISAVTFYLLKINKQFVRDMH